MASFFKNHHGGCVYINPHPHWKSTMSLEGRVNRKEGYEMQKSEQTFSYVNNTTDIIRELRHSKDHGNVVGICAISLGPNMVMAAVEELLEIKNDLLIVLKSTDLLGMKLPEEQIFLSEIVRVHPFRTRFDDPFHVKLREMRTRHSPEDAEMKLARSFK